MTISEAHGLYPMPRASFATGLDQSHGLPTKLHPPIKCEGVAFLENGEYRVAKVRGDFACPDLGMMQTIRSMPRVSSWASLPNGRVKILRTDVPSHFEEWELFAVQNALEFFGIQFNAGDLVAYLRREPGNEINAVTTFRHLQRQK